MKEKLENDDDKNSKEDHHLIINNYIEYGIIKENISLPLVVLISVYLLMQKVNDNLMTNWQAVFYPIYGYLGFQFVLSFVKIIRTESNEEMDMEISLNGSKVLTKSSPFLKINNIDRIVLISNFFSLVNYALVFLSIYYFGEFLDHKEDMHLYSTLYMLASLCISHIIYSIFRKTSLFTIKRKSEVEDTDESKSSVLAFITSISTPLLTYLSNMMIVCSSSSGVCTQVYMSTITSLLGAFGVTISDFSDYLFPVTIVLLCISLFSLYIKNKRLTHKPFLLGVSSCFMIIFAHLLEETWVYYLLYPGNILMIVAAIWNARMNKFYGLPRYNK